MRRTSSDLTGGLLIACGAGCLVTSLTCADEVPVGLEREPLALILWGGLFVAWGAYLVARTRVDGTGALVRAVRMLQPLASRSEEDVRKWLGAPHGVTGADNGDWDLTWDAPSYSITLRFRDGVCLSVVREVVRQP